MIFCPHACNISLTQLYPPYFLIQIFGFWVTCGVKMMWLCHGWGWQPPQTASHIHIRHLQSNLAHWYAVHRHTVAALNSFTHLGSDFGGYVVTCGVEIMHFCFVWGWQPPQTASHIHIRCIKSGWAHWYAFHGHTVSPLHRYTHPTWHRFWGSGSLGESKWCDYVMFESDSQLKLLLHPYWTYTKWLSILICYRWANSITLTQFYPPYLAQILGYVVTCGVKIMHFCHGWCWQQPQTASHLHIRHIKSGWAHWYSICVHTVSVLHSYTHPAWLRFWGPGHLWSQNDAIMSWMRLTATSNFFPHPY